MKRNNHRRKRQSKINSKHQKKTQRRNIISEKAPMKGISEKAIKKASAA